MRMGLINCFVLLLFTYEQSYAQPLKLHRLILYFPELAQVKSNTESVLSLDAQLQAIIKEMKKSEQHALSKRAHAGFSHWIARIREWYFTLMYPIDINFYRSDAQAGIYLFDFSPFLSKKSMQAMLCAQLKEKNISCHIEEDCSVIITDALPDAQLLNDACMQPYWHYTYPTTGMNGAMRNSSYLPHRFCLTELAPSQGKGVTVALIDTGVAAFKVGSDKRFYKHDDLMVAYDQLGSDNLNVTSGKINPLSIVIEYLKPYCSLDSAWLIENNILNWIARYKNNADITPIREFLCAHGIPDISQDQELTPHGSDLLNAFLKKLNSFSFGLLAAPYDHYAILNFLPAPYRKEYQTASFATHGSHIYGILAAQCSKKNGYCGLVPQANVIMIKAFDEMGVSSKSVLITALKKAQLLNADIVNLSLKIADQLDTSHHSSYALEHMLKEIPYIVAASGNEGDPAGRDYKGAFESYPARFECVAFDVGAFGVGKNGAFIPSFCQYEKNHGPLFVAPGVNIYSTDFRPLHYEHSSYLPRHGTSMAAALVSCYVALILGEFKDRFCKEELLKVCYRSALKLNDTPEWQEKTVLGAFDVRTALFVLHCVDGLKKENLSLTFDQLAAGVFHLIEQPLKKNGSIDWKGSIAHEYQAFENSSGAQTVAQAVMQIKDSILNKELAGVQDAIKNSQLCFAQLPERVQKLVGLKN